MVEPESAGGQSLNSSNGFCLKVYIGLSWGKSGQFGQVVLSGDGIALLLLQNSAISLNKKETGLGFIQMKNWLSNNGKLANFLPHETYCLNLVFSLL